MTNHPYSVTIRLVNGWGYGMDFSNKIKEIRICNNLTQSDLAHECCVSRSTIANWEAGRRKPDWESIVKISELFNVPIEELLDRKKVNNQTNLIDVKNDIFDTDKYYSSFISTLNIISSILIMILLLSTIVPAVNGKFNRFNRKALDIENVSLSIKSPKNSVNVYYFSELNTETGTTNDGRSFQICNLMIDQSKFFKYQYCYDLLCVLDFSIQYKDYNLKSKFDEKRYILKDNDNNMIKLLLENNSPYITEPGVYDFTLTINDNLYYIGAYLK